MKYNKIISYIYAIVAIIVGTYFSIDYIYYYVANLRGYYSRKETIGIIKNINCYDKDSCYSDIEYTINNIKYVNNTNLPSNNLKIGDKVKIKYNENNPNEIFVYGNYHIYSFIYIILLIIFIILLLIFLFIVIAFPSIYNKYIFLIYAIIANIIISYICYLNIHNNYFDLYNYKNYKENTIGIIKSQDYCDDNEMCYSNIEYLIDDVKHNVKILTFHYKIGENVKIYYNKDYPEIIKIHDKNKNKKLIKIIIYAIILALLWIFLIFNIPFILK